jgi:hypothetical protein
MAGKKRSCDHGRMNGRDGGPRSQREVAGNSNEMAGTGRLDSRGSHLFSFQGARVMVFGALRSSAAIKSNGR